MVDVMEYDGLVIYLARREHKRLLNADVTIELEDLVQEGFLGLAEAANRYEPARGVKFATFAHSRITGAIKDYLRRLDPLNQSERQKLRELNEVKEQLMQFLGRAPLESELAETLGVSEEELRNIETSRIIKEPIDVGEEAPEQSGVEISTPPDQERMLLGQEVDDCLEEALEDTERSVLIFRMVKELTLREVGEILELGIETVRRREAGAQLKMKLCLEDKGWEVGAVLSLYK